MLSRVLTTVGLAASLLFGATNVFADGHIQYSTVSLNVRTGPSTSYDRFATLKKCQKVEVLRCVSDYGAPWCEVSWNYQTGWVAAKYLAKKDICYYAPKKKYKQHDYHAPKKKYTY